MRVIVNLYVLWIVLTILRRSMAWVGLAFFSKGVVAVLFGIVSVWYFIKKYNSPKLTKQSVLPFLLIILGSFLLRRSNLSRIVADVFAYLPVLTFLLLPVDTLKQILYSVKNIFAWLVGLSLFLYFLYLAHIPIPNFGYEHFQQYDFYNYCYLFLYNPEYEIRYCGLCLEPGYYSLLLVSLIMINRFDFRLKSTWVYIVALLCTLSLGGYLLLIIGFVVYSLIKQGNVNKALAMLAVIVVSLTALTVFALNYNNGNNILVDKIVMRLVFDEDIGIAGNNREGLMAQPIIDSFFYSDSVWMGVGDDVFKKAIDFEGYDACSWREFVIRYGATYTIFFLFISILMLKKTNVKVVLPFYLVWLADFYQHGNLFMGSFFLLVLFGCANRLERSNEYSVPVLNNVGEKSYL